MNYRETPITRRHSATQAASLDMGLRAFMLKVYNFMGLALALTGGVAYLISTNTQLAHTLYATNLRWVVMLLPLALVLIFSFRLHRMTYPGAQLLFWIYSASVGLSLGFIFLVYTGESIARVFFISAATFGATSLYGYTTQRDLTSFGSFFMMGLFGLIIASLVNIFLKSSALAFAISAIGVLVFVGLTAYDTQKIRQAYLESDGTEVMGKKALLGALTLYLDFINLFIMMLRLFGDRR